MSLPRLSRRDDQMPKRKKTGARTTVDQGFVKSLSHELRVEIMTVLSERVASPNELATMLNVGLSGVSYHVKVLKDYGRIELVRTEPRRGAVEHYYRATSKSLLPAKTWRGIKRGVRAAFGGGLASDLFDELADALPGGKLAKSNSHICRMPLVLDAEGWKNVVAMAERFTAEVEAEQHASAARAAKANGGAAAASAYTVGVLAFESTRKTPGKTGPAKAKRKGRTGGK